MFDQDTFQHRNQKSLILQNKDFCFQSLNVSGPDWLIQINWLIHRFYVKSRLKCKDKIETRKYDHLLQHILLALWERGAYKWELFGMTNIWNYNNKE